jgi:glutaminase
MFFSLTQNPVAKIKNTFRSFSPEISLDFLVDVIGDILPERKKSIARLMSETVEHLNPSFDGTKESAEDVVYDLFKVPNKDEASIGRLLSVLRSMGLNESDPRLIPTIQKIREHDNTTKDDDEWMDVKRYRLPREEFKDCVHPSISLISQALRNELVVPSWKEFITKIEEIFNECKCICDGNLATYIPQLGRVDPNLWGLSICTIDGQRFSCGNSNVPFCFQSVSKAFNYAVASTDLDSEYVHRFVGHEPSGRLFNEICLDGNSKPHNPMINSGAIIITSLLKRGRCLADRYDAIFNEYKKIAGGEYVIIVYSYENFTDTSDLTMLFSCLNVPQLIEIWHWLILCKKTSVSHLGSNQ